MTRLLFFLFFFISSAIGDSNEYWLVSQYLNKNPKEQKVSLYFSRVVREQPIPIKNQSKPVKIMMVYPGNQISDYWRRSKVSFEKRMTELQIDYTLENHFTKPGTVREQAKHLLQGIKEDVDYLIFTLDVKKHSKIIEVLINKVKPKVILQNITTPLKKWGDIQPFLYVGFDHKIGSLKIANHFISKTGKKGNYAVLYGTQGYVSKMRGDSVIRHFNQKTDLKMVASYYTDFNKQKAYKATLDLLKENKDLKFIYACSTDIAHGAIEALKKLGLKDKILVNGWGGGGSELKAILKGDMDTTVIRINDDNGVAMAEAIKLDLEGKKKSVPLIYSGDMKLIEKGISKSKIDHIRKKAFRYSD